MKVLVKRTAMVGGGLSYDVWVPISEISHYSVSKYQSTTICHNGTDYQDYVDATMTLAHYNSEKGWDRYQEYLSHEKTARREMLVIAKKVFTELNQINRDSLPTLWTVGLMPRKQETSEQHFIDI